MESSRSPFKCARSLNPHGAYAPVGGEDLRLLLPFAFVGWWFRLTTNKTIRLIMLKQNQDLAYLSERFEAGELVPVIDGPDKLSDAREACRHYGSGNHKGKVVIMMERWGC